MTKPALAEPNALPLWSAVIGHSADTVTVILLLGLVAGLGPGEARGLALGTLCATLVLGVLVALLKQVFRRERPRGEWGAVYRRTDPYAFPSGHAARVGLLAVVAWSVAPAWLGPGLSVWAVAVCFSRLTLGVHRLGDVFWGLVLGMAFGWLWTILNMPNRLGMQLLEFV